MNIIKITQQKISKTNEKFNVLNDNRYLPIQNLKSYIVMIFRISTLDFKLTITACLWFTEKKSVVHFLEIIIKLLFDKKNITYFSSTARS